MSDNRDVIIYGVIDPRTNECRYVGKTVDMKKRIYKHLSTARVKCINHKDYLIRSIVKEGLDPIFVKLEIIQEGRDWEESERFWIAYLKSLGASLCNHTSGGEGSAGHVQSEETKRKRALNWVGRHHSEESKIKMSESKKGVLLSEEVKAKLKSVARRGEDNKFSKYTDAIVKEVIDSFFTSKLNRKELALVMNISHASVVKMVSGKAWSHLDWFREQYKESANE